MSSLTEQRLSDAIQSRTLDAVLATPSTDAQGTALIAQARACLFRVETETSALLEQIETALESVGVTPLSTEKTAQIQRVHCRIAPQDLYAALEGAADCGFNLARRIGPGAALALSTSEDGIDLIRQDDVYTRLSFTWRDPAIQRAYSPLRPRMEDYLFCRLPKFLAPAYSAVKLPRKVLGKFGLRPGLSDWLAQKSLGTPASLAQPLVQFAEIEPSDHLVDVGCGDGRALIEMVRHSGCQATGIEMDSVCASLAKDAVAKAGLSNQIRIIAAAATSEMLNNATVLFTFQPPAAQSRLVPFLLDARPIGARLLVHEQSPLADVTKPDRSRPLFGENAMTVAHLWLPRQA